MISSLYLFDLLDSVSPGVVNRRLVSTLEGQEELLNNAKYAISVALKIGATVFTTYEDIVEGKRKMISLLVASVMKVALSKEDGGFIVR